MRTTATLTEGWHVRQLEPGGCDVAELARQAHAPGDEWLTARMPAQVHDVLLEHGLIPDPHVGRNAADCAWVGEKDWAYATTFPTPAGAGGPVFVRFGGLDTLAEAFVNGTSIGRFANMFREFVVDVAERLAPPGDDNVLLVVFSSPLRFVDAVEQPPEHVGRIVKQKYLRKSFNDFSTYLGARPHFVKVGVYGDVVVDAPGPAWIEDVCVRTQLSAGNGRAVVRADVATGGSAAAVEWRVCGPDGEEIGAGTGPVELAVDGPRLWWPRTYGSPALHELEVRLLCDGEAVDVRRVRFGIRDLRLVTDEGGEKHFRFEVNGRPVFLRGACWAPVEGATHCWQPERAAKLLDLAEHGHMNAVRVWGGGLLPEDGFYDECDRRGLLVWQDFMFGYGMYPDDDAGFVESCRTEVEGVVRRLRNHACVALWCGGNENHMGWDFQFGGEPAVGRGLFEEVMPEVCARLDPTRPYHASSPSGGRAPNWPLEGDWHDYTTLTFPPRSSVPLFVSELGRASAPSVRSMRRFMSQEDLWPEGHDARIAAPGRPAWPPMWQYRSVDGSWDKVGPVEEFCNPTGPEDLVRALGTAHGEYLQRRVERHRRGVPDGEPDGTRRCWGNLIWRLNDSWPIVYWSAVDYYLEPKVAYYFLRRAYKPVLVCFERTPDRLAAWIVNDSPEPVAGTLVVTRQRLTGEVVGRLSADVEVAPAEARRCLDTADLGPISLRNEFLRAEFAGLSVTCLLTGERHLHLPEATLTVGRTGDWIEVSTDAFARQVTLDVDGATGAVFEDNFFDLPPGGGRMIGVVDPAGGRRVTGQAYNSGPVTVDL